MAPANPLDLPAARSGALERGSDGLYGVGSEQCRTRSSPRVLPVDLFQTIPRRAAAAVALETLYKLTRVDGIRIRLLCPRPLKLTIPI